MRAKIWIPVVVIAVLITASTPAAVSAGDLRDEVASAIELFKSKDAHMAQHFDSAYAYAVFPKIGKGAIGVGGAHGDGLVYQGGKLVAGTSLSQFTVGLQFGGQVYQEVIFFENETTFNNFKGGHYELSAQASAIAASAGASADAAYKHGVMVFTLGKAGLMYEASVGGQKFNYRAY